MLDKIHRLDPKYDPLIKFKPFYKKMDHLMENFDEVMYDLMDEVEQLEILGSQEIRKEPPKVATQRRLLSKPPWQRPQIQRLASPLKGEPEKERLVPMPSRGRIIYKRLRDEGDSKKEEEIKRKGKGIMEQEKPIEPQHRPLKGEVIVDVESPPKRSLSPPPSPTPSERQKFDKA